MSESETKIEKIAFKGDNWLHWKTKVYAWADSKALSKYLEPIATTLTADDKKSQKKLKSMLVQSLDDNVLGLFINESQRDIEPHVLWNKMISYYERKSTDSKHMLRDKMYNERLMDDEPMGEMTGRVMQTAQRLINIGDPPTDSDIVYAITKALPPQYLPFTSMLKTNSNLTSDQLKAHLTDYQQSLKQQNESNQPKSLHFVSNPMSKKRNFSQTNNSNNNHVQHRKPVFCNHCHRRGHLRNECWQLHGKPSNLPQHNASNLQNNANATSSSDANAKEGNLSQATNLLTNLPASQPNDDSNKANFFTRQNWTVPSNIWILDSGASNHFTNCLAELSNIKIIDEAIMTAGQTVVQVQQMGTVQIETGTYTLILNEVRYSPHFTTKIISINKITNKQANVLFEHDKVSVTLNEKLILKGTKWNNLWIVSTLINTSLLSVNLHDRLGHINQPAIQQMIKKDVFDNLSCTPHDIVFCPSCSQGKASRKPFKDYSSQPKATHVLGTLHADIAGPFRIESDPLQVLRLYKMPSYFLIIVDEFSGKIWTELMTEKGQAAPAIKSYIELAEKVTGQKVKRFHSDNGGEFNSTFMDDYMKGKVIEKTNSLDFTPEHNGTAERNIRTIKETARTLLIHAKLDQSFWPAAVLTATYLHGFRVKHESKKTINEIFFQQRPNINHLRVFGCDCYTFIPDHKRSTFDKKSIPTIFIGYPPQKTSGYSCAGSTTKKDH